MSQIVHCVIFEPELQDPLEKVLMVGYFCKF